MNLLLLLAVGCALLFSKLGHCGPRFLFTHSHNDYQQKHPLYDALAYHFTSLEADLWLRDGEILISHLGWKFKGTLKDLYLDPMQKLVSQKGSLYGDGRKIYLWFDLKDPSPALLAKLEELLAQYPMFTVFSKSGQTKGAVTAILTGDESKTSFAKKFPVRHACRDSNVFRIQDPTASPNDDWQWYSLEWSDYFRWSGRGPMPDVEKQRLAAMIEAIHKKGRQVRFWDTPETEEFWSQATSAEVDMIGTDHLAQFKSFTRQLASTGVPVEM